MSIQKLFAVLFVLILTTLLALFICVGALVRNAVEVERAEERKFRSQLIADELRQSSDDLTRMARLYVITGEERYKAYFDEIIAIRNGEAPRPERYWLVYWDLVREGGERPRPAGEAQSIDNRMVEEGFTVAEFSKLQEARTRSDALARIESVAMNAVEGRFDDGTGSFLRKGDPDPGLARELMFGSEYMEIKANIMEPINEFIVMVEERTALEAEKLMRRGRVLGWTALALSLAAVCVAGSTLIVLRRRVLVPLGSAVESAEAVAHGELDHPIAYNSTDEMGRFVKTYNSMLGRVGRAVAGLETANSELKSQSEELRKEKERSDKLLLNILPASIADRLKSGETKIADTFPEVTVLFADLVGFTPLTEQLGPQEIVRILNEVFAIFDREAELHNVEKVKTIGDSYMAVSGLPEPTADHAQNVAEFALNSRDAIERYAQENDLDVRVRMGFHSGTAVAGIVGKKRFAYDLWGDVVNVASRMESSGRPARIQVSEPSMVRLRDLFELEATGEIEVKGKGPMKTWFLNGKRYSNAEQAGPEVGRRTT